VEIDRKAFLALAVSMNSSACIVVQQRDTIPQPATQNVQIAQPSQPAQVVQVNNPGYPPAPNQECVGWGPNGACNRWVSTVEGGGYGAPTAEAYAPTQECIGYAPTGECNRWLPTSEK
jgi:hypothetical protein